MHPNVPRELQSQTLTNVALTHSQVDNYALYAASAIAGVVSFRAFAGFGFPLFADTMFGALGDGRSTASIHFCI